MALRKKRRHQPQPKTQATKLSPQTDNQALQTFTEHIRELRKRLFWSVLVGIVVGTLVYMYHDFFIKLVMEPLNGQKLIYLTPTGGFSFIFMVTFYVTILLILPFLMYQLYAFLKPAIPKHVKHVSIKVILAATFLMALGASFGYLYAVPGGLKFLTEFASGYVTPSLTAESYLSFVLAYVFGIGIIFELPLLLLFWHWIHPLTPKKLLNSERFIIVGAFIAAAIISPTPDALSQTIIAVPIIIVYQFGVIAVLLSVRKAKKIQKKALRVQQQVKPEPVQEVPPVQPVVKPQPLPVSEVVPKKPVPVVQPAQIKRRTASMDGMVSRGSRPMVGSTPAQHTSISKQTPQPVVSMAPRPQPKLQVPRRTLISDIGPVRG
jgi:sec-independent protein translocase protein TatC